MKANRAYRLIVTRGGRGPAFLADTPFGAPGASRQDRIEVVSVHDGEPILYWELPARRAARLVKELRSDLVGLQAEEFIALWEGADGSRS